MQVNNSATTSSQEASSLLILQRSLSPSGRVKLRLKLEKPLLRGGCERRSKTNAPPEQGRSGETKDCEGGGRENGERGGADEARDALGDDQRRPATTLRWPGARAPEKRVEESRRVGTRRNMDITCGGRWNGRRPWARRTYLLSQKALFWLSRTGSN